MRRLRFVAGLTSLVGALAFCSALLAEEETAKPDSPSKVAAGNYAEQPPTVPLRAEISRGEKVADRDYLLLLGLSYAATIADIELTQRCLHKGTCHEGNPLLSTKRAVLYPMQIGYTTGMNVLGYYLKKRRVQSWWIPQVGIVGGHGVGVSFGLRFVW